MATTAPVGAQPGNEPGEDHRRLPGSGRSDDGHEPLRRHQRREVGDDAVATVERPCVGLVEGAQPAVRVHSRSRCRGEVAGGDPPGIGRDRAVLPFAVPDSRPPCQHELGHALVAISDGPLQDGIETVGHPRHPPDEARNAIGPRRPACRGRHSGRARSAEQLPGHPAETSDVGGDDVTGSVGRVGDAEVGQVGGAVRRRATRSMPSRRCAPHRHRGRTSMPSRPLRSGARRAPATTVHR